MRGTSLSFRSRIKESAERNSSNIVLALDLDADKVNRLLSRSIEILEAAYPYICAVKINHHLVLPLGLFDGVSKILKLAHDFGLPTIMDCKINDIGNTNRVIAEQYFKAGFDAVIANPFVGWEEGLEPVFEVVKQMDRGVILLVYMSHKAASEGYGQSVYDPKENKMRPQYLTFAEKALSWNADGVVVGATYPEKIREVNTILKNQVPIYSPGIGVQGGEIEATITAGAHYLIIGRSITLSNKPMDTAKTIRDAVNKLLR